MDETRQNRLWQMRRLVKLAGGANAAAEKLGRSPAYVTAIAGPNPPEKYRRQDGSSD